MGPRLRTQFGTDLNGETAHLSDILNQQDYLSQKPDHLIRSDLL